MQKNKDSDQLRKMMQQAQGHIKKKEYAEARVILEGIDAKIDNPTVKKWLAQLDRVAPKDDLFGDMDFPEPKKKRGKLWWIGVSMAACISLIVCSQIAVALNIIPDADERDATEAVATAATGVVLSQTPPTATLAPSETPLPSDTPTLTYTPTITNTPAPSATHTITPIPTDVPTEDTSSIDKIRIESAIRGFTDVDLQSVEIADGRANGGERVLLVAYVSPSSQQISDLGSVIGSLGGIIQLHEIGLDSIVLIYGASPTSDSTIISLQVVDLLAYMNDEITIEELVARMN